MSSKNEVLKTKKNVSKPAFLDTRKKITLHLDKIKLYTSFPQL